MPRVAYEPTIPESERAKTVHALDCVATLIISKLTNIKCRSQWPRGLRHELSSLARTVGSRIRIPLKTWMFVFVFILFVLGWGHTCAQNASVARHVVTSVVEIERNQ
jgi:hypothetical protein